MTPTELKLVAIYKGPTVQLAEISRRYLGVDNAWAVRQANKNRLPFPTFRLTEPKGPLMVTTTDLAKFIDMQHETAEKSWKNSQV